MKASAAVTIQWPEQSGGAPDRMEEACGVFGVLASGQQVSSLCYFGLYACSTAARKPLVLRCLRAIGFVFTKTWAW